MWLVGGMYGCGYQEVGVGRRDRCVVVKEVYRFPHITYSYSTSSI